MALTRSQQLSRIRGENTAQELRLRRALWADRQRYLLQAKTPVGRPDMVFLGTRVAVFADRYVSAMRSTNDDAVIWVPQPG